MTLAVSAATSSQPTAPHTVPIVILGTDALLAASPATPVQLAHACLRAGFANAVPASWGDELVAAAVLRRLPNYGSGPVIQCSCPIVAHRLLTVGGDLRPVMLPLVPPPVAAARYVRSLAQPTRTRITYVGACPGAIDESIDIRMTPDALLAMLAERDIVVEDQPLVFEAVIPPDRRRHRSQPGGVPTAEALWTELGARTLVEIDGEDFVADVAQHLLTGKSVLIDTSTRLGCACSGAVAGARHPRSAVTALEPPRSTTPVVDERAPINLDLPVPATSRTPIDIAALPATPPATRSATPPIVEPSFGNRFSPVRASAPIPEVRSNRPSNPITPRPVLSAFPIARDVDGRALPRAYVARRRQSPKAGLSISLPLEESDSGPRARAVKVGSAAASSIGTEPAPATRPTAGAPESTAPAAVVMEPAAALPSQPPVAPVPVSPSPYTPDVPRPPVPQSAPEPAPPPASAPPVTAEAAPTPQRRTEPARSSAARRDTRPPAPPPAAAWTLSRGQLIGILIAILMIAISVSTVVAILVGRSIGPSGTPPLGR